MRRIPKIVFPFHEQNKSTLIDVPRPWHSHGGWKSTGAAPQRSDPITMGSPTATRV